MIDHTNLAPDVTEKELVILCQEAIEYGFKMVAINQVNTAFCSKLLKDTQVHVGAAISFPLGQTTIESKVNETIDAISEGADEIDYVINISKLKEKNYVYIKNEMEQIVDICKKHNVISKVIFETCYLDNDEIISLCEIANEVKPDFIKTSTGFGTAGATTEHIKLMSKHTDGIGIKAAGGIRDLETFKKMCELGATRIGTSSGINILKELELK